jgi:cyclopropane fatty-acyl-phospholipid synthase-like methyltransferase
MDSDFIRKQYNKVAEKYFILRKSFKSEPYLKKFSSFLPKGVTILDIGCGSGIPVDSYFTKHDFKVIGIDISDKQIELARKNVPSASFEQKDMSKLKNNEYQVGAVVSFYAIFHTPRETHLDLFRKIKTFIPKKAYILVTMGYDEWEGAEKGAGGEMMEWSHYGADKNREIIEKAGFQIVFNKIDTSGGEKHLVIIAKNK